MTLTSRYLCLSNNKFQTQLIPKDYTWTKPIPRLYLEYTYTYTSNIPIPIPRLYLEYTHTYTSTIPIPIPRLYLEYTHTYTSTTSTVPIPRLYPYLHLDYLDYTSTSSTGVQLAHTEISNYFHQHFPAKI
eukprot:gene773-4061_t